MKIIYILWLRQIKRYLRSKSRIIGSVGQPLLFLVALGFGFGPVFEQAGQGSYLSFLAPGVIAMSILFTSLFSGVEIIWDKQFGFLKETLVAPVSRLQIMIGRTIGGATVAVLQGVVVLAITFAFGFNPPLYSILPALVFMILIALLFAGLGTIFASFLDDMQGFQLIMNFIIMPIFFLSGALFPLEGLSSTFRAVLSFNPLAYGVDGLRGAFTGVAYFGLGTDLLILSVVSFIILIIGSYSFTKIKI